MEIQGSLWLLDRTNKATKMDTMLATEMFLVHGEAHPRALSHHGILAVGKGHMYAGAAFVPIVEAFESDGRRLATLELRSGLRAPTLVEYARELRDGVMFMPDGPVRDGLLNARAQLPKPEFAPAYSQLFVDPDGWMWAVLTFPGDSGTWLRAATSRGELVGDLRLARNLWVTEVGHDYVLGVGEDELNEPHVLLYRFRRSLTPSPSGSDGPVPLQRGSHP